jgi:hypothetical protein
MGTDDMMNKYLNGFICLQVEWWVQGMEGEGHGKEAFCFNLDQWHQKKKKKTHVFTRVLLF